ncbi:F0F1 ATP synthase subunit epsilon [Anaerolineales bacterium HSG6]|nr:F0F1 ATP synthase subunit epsilon [Anaerolineales bacterium HSG6]MDM8530318.1 F0F1 ATP synthase subunit epsilon [Anaerolineales bacterium HSG25]
MVSKIRLEILTIEGKLFDEEIDMVVAPGIEGVFGVLPNHAPLLTTLNYGELQVKRSGQPDEFFAIGGGFIEVRPDHVVVMADSAERADEIDVSRAEESRLRAQSSLEKRGETIEFEKAQDSLKRSALRVKIAKRRGRRSRG